MKVAGLIGVNSRIIRLMDMEHNSGLMETNTLDNTRKTSFTGMEFSSTRMEECIKDNIFRVKEKVTHIAGGQTVMSTTDSGRIIICTEKE